MAADTISTLAGTKRVTVYRFADRRPASGRGNPADDLSEPSHQKKSRGPRWEILLSFDDKANADRITDAARRASDLKEARMNQDDYNLTDPTFFAKGDPDAIWRRLRREDPIHWTKGRLGRGFWSVTRYEDVKNVYLRDNRTFLSQAWGASLPPGPEFENPETNEFLRLFQAGAQLSGMDGEPHAILRKAFSEKFALPAVNKLEDVVRRITLGILDDVQPHGECDFAVDVAGRLPVAVIADMMGVPSGRWNDMYLWNNMVASPEDPEFSIGSPFETSKTGLAAINSFCLDLARERRRNPRDDVMTMIAHAEINGERLNDDRLAFNGMMFFAAGHETTRNTLAAGLWELVNEPAEMVRLRALRHDPQALRVATEEFVRWSSPLTHVLRTAAEDTEVGGQKVAAGDWVVLWNLSANRDERIFQDPYRFNIQRTPNQHLGFALGKHFCLGAHLARLEIRILLEYMMEHMHNIELAGPPQIAASNLFCGIKHMPIAFTPTRRPTTH
jgi:cytochrome P450